MVLHDDKFFVLHERKSFVVHTYKFMMCLTACKRLWAGTSLWRRDGSSGTSTRPTDFWMFQYFLGSLLNGRSEGIVADPIHPGSELFLVEVVRQRELREM